MVKLVKVFGLLAFVALGVFAFSTRSADTVAAASLEFSAAGAVSPRSLYVQNCARCHGSDGRSDTKEGRRLEADDLTTGDAKGISNDKLTRVIKNGRGKMPGFGKKLTPAQIAQIASYVRSL